jgi:short chain dehydrogenase
MRPPSHDRTAFRHSVAFMKRPTIHPPATGWAVITGASSGLGREFALALSESGYPVLAVARRRERLQAMADPLFGGRPSRPVLTIGQEPAARSGQYAPPINLSA